MSGFRSHAGQQSDRVPIKRSLDEKKRMLAQLKQQQQTMKAWVADTVKQSIAKRIAELEVEIKTMSR